MLLKNKTRQGNWDNIAKEESSKKFKTSDDISQMEVSPLELNIVAKDVSIAQMSNAKHKSIKLCII